MVEGNVRVLLAAESPQERSILRQLIEREGGVEVVAQAKDVPDTLTLVSNLRPDVAVIDSRLPYATGLNSLPLSRINGLDAAQAIIWQAPRTGVLLLNNLESIALSGGSSSPDLSLYSIVSAGNRVPVVSRESGPAPSGLPLFASVLVRPEAPAQRKEALADKCVVLGALSFAGGWLLVLTIVLAPVGVALVLAGIAAMVFGLGARISSSMWRGVRGQRKGPQQG